MKPFIVSLMAASLALTGVSATAGITCPTNFIPIPANPAMGTFQDFCVSKYEMKIVGEDIGDQVYTNTCVAESRPSGTPWINMCQERAKEECEALGPGYALINDAEWMTIARNIESVAANWSDHVAHDYETTTARLCTGHTCREDGPGPFNVGLGSACRADMIPYSGEGLPASTNDAEGCYGYEAMGSETEPPTLNSNGWNAFRRTFFLDNGEVIWDFGGNVWEWLDWYVPLAADRAWPDEGMSTNFFEINAPLPGPQMPERSFKSSKRDLVPVVPPYTNMNQNRFGRYHPTTNDYTTGVAMRGGNYMHGSVNNGIYALAMGYAPLSTTIICRVGFRCVYYPQSEDHDEDGDGVRDIDERVAGTNPAESNDYARLTVFASGGVDYVRMDTRLPSGRGAPEYDRYYALDRCDNLVSGEWTAVSGYTNLPATGHPVLCPHPAGSNTFYSGRIRLEPR
jgi:hypothetical protein